tara:strand:+ start:1212 stop:1328 length:117 start_codon:yes stop_codon:yes gene_type:complete
MRQNQRRGARSRYLMKFKARRNHENAKLRASRGEEEEE